MNRTTKKEVHGFSVVELLVVVMIIGVMAALAVTQLGASRDHLQEQNLVRELKVNLERARFDSIKRNAKDAAMQASVTLNSPTTYQVKLDTNQNGIFESGETRNISFGSGNIARLVGTSNYPITMRFDHRGNVTSTNGLNVPHNPTFTICTEHCDENRVTAGNASVLAVTPSGTVVVLRGGETLDVISAPNVSTVPPSNAIKCEVYVRQYGNSSTCGVLVTNPTPTNSNANTP